ncbi:hypothetical protein BDK51DRAFT_38030 [Blyttiomyces helicus]|uniref:Uncharacterized protein n=1 Tax=Blyttiomyces helicus TaxID=388810 RepID=A0A4P9WP93_9FUNG|nr:hypothetical protein BDK51DRAFT_38030 [Blyttiomyces helicus]|eukprot:RKO92616.1 hypothetical protein BDK51DRAFT_38030 [Blyttiomyces helicus]
MSGRMASAASSRTMDFAYWCFHDRVATAWRVFCRKERGSERNQSKEERAKFRRGAHRLAGRHGSGFCGLLLDLLLGQLMDGALNSVSLDGVERLDLRGAGTDGARLHAVCAGRGGVEQLPNIGEESVDRIGGDFVGKLIMLKLLLGLILLSAMLLNLLLSSADAVAGPVPDAAAARPAAADPAAAAYAAVGPASAEIAAAASARGKPNIT